MNVIAKSYWRRVQFADRKFGTVPDSVKDDVRALARADVEAGTIDREEYLALIGEDFPEESF